MKKRRAADLFLHLVQSFFSEYLHRMRDVGHHTVLSYRDALRLFFDFVAEQKHCSVADLRIEDLTAERVLDFLDHVEQDRHNSVSTRNARLTALRSFFKYLVHEDPLHAAQFGQILSVERKLSAARPVTRYLEPEEVQVVLKQPDQRRTHGVRDHALLLFLYNTGARISEALAVCRSDLELDRPRHVRIHGKGRQERTCPLWRSTAAALKRLFQMQDIGPGDRVFQSRRRQPLTRYGATYILKKHVTTAAKETPSIAKKRVTPHVLRHSCAVALLQSGVDLIVIRDYLGHQSVATTGRYTKSNLRMKRRALEAFWTRSGLSSRRHARWSPTPELLAFLTSL